MYPINVSKSVGPEYVPAVNDAVRMVTIQVFTHLMLSMADQNVYLMGPEFWVTLGYILIGTALYHLVLARFLPVV